MSFRESFHIELKAELNDSAKKEIIAFANTEGGKIHIGIDDDGNVIIIESDGGTFEKKRCLRQDLAFDYAKLVFKQKELTFKDAQYRTLGIADDDGYYTNLGLLLSDQCEHSIKCAIYQGNNKLTFKERKEFSGSILKQLEAAYEYINLFNRVESFFEGLSRVEVPNYPYFAIRETLINAVVHRDYSFSGSILIHIFDDRIEFVSIGGLVSGLTLNDIFLGVSESRNKNLAACFYRLKLIESYGTSIQRVKDSYKEYDVKPDFNISEHAFVVTLPKANLNIEVETNEEKALRVIKAKRMVVRKDLEKELGLSKSSVTLILNKFLNEGQIIQKGNARSTTYHYNN